VLGFAIFRFGLGHFLAKSYEYAKDKDYIQLLRLLNLFVLGLFTISCSVAGFFISKKKQRDQITWAILCFFFTFWALIILILLPASSPKRKDELRKREDKREDKVSGLHY
jgi:O-antigen/teichoic acid export membrane protein